jgi:cholesterol transport system auxiliary component
VICAVVAVSVGGCSALTGGGAPPTYDLTAPNAAQSKSRAHHGQLVVSEPTALSVLDTDKILVRSAGDQIAHMASAQWSDRLPRLLQSRIVQAFENANRLTAVGTPSDRLTADFQLVTDVRAFELSVVSAPVAQVEIAAKVVSDRGGKVVAARVFRASIPATSTAAPDAALALDEAFHRVATEMVEWASRLV